MGIACIHGSGGWLYDMADRKAYDRTWTCLNNDMFSQ